MPPAPDDLDPAAVILTAGVGLIILFLFVAILSAAAGILGVQGAELVRADGDTLSIDDRADEVAVYDSSGHAATFGSGSGHIAVPTDGGVGDGNTTAVVWVDLHEDASNTSEYHAANLGNGVASVQYRSDRWYAIYNRTDGGGVAEVTAPAPTPYDRTMVGVRANGTHLGLVRSGSVVNATAFSAGNASVPSARTWWGGQDELRVWGSPLTDQQLADLEADPIGPLAQGNVTLRLMLDESSGDETRVLPSWTATASLAGDVGFTADGLEPTQYSSGQDYRYSGGGEIEVVQGSRLDEARAAFVSYQSGVYAWLSEVNSIIALAAFLPILVILTFILVALSSAGGRVR